MQGIPVFLSRAFEEKLKAEPQPKWPPYGGLGGGSGRLRRAGIQWNPPCKGKTLKIFSGIGLTEAKTRKTEPQPVVRGGSEEPEFSGIHGEKAKTLKQFSGIGLMEAKARNVLA